MSATLVEQPVLEETKILSVSSKRQITIPQKFYKYLGLGSEIECTLHENELILRPKRESSNGEFAEEILADLINEGLTGEALLTAFKKRQAQIRPAVKALLQEAKDAAKQKCSSFSYDEVFGEEE